MKTASISSSNFTAKKCNDSISLSSLDFFCGRCRTIMFGEKVDATLRQRLKPNVLPIYATTILTSTEVGTMLQDHQHVAHQVTDALEARPRVGKSTHLTRRRFGIPRGASLQLIGHRLRRERKPSVTHHASPQAHRVIGPPAARPALSVQRARDDDVAGHAVIRRVLPQHSTVELSIDHNARGIYVESLEQCAVALPSDIHRDHREW